MLSALKVFPVVFVTVGLPFKRDVVIGVASLGEAVEPFHDVEDVEEDERHLFHLRGVYPLMVDEPWCQSGVGSAQQDAADVDGGESRKRQIFVLDDDHRLQR